MVEHDAGVIATTDEGDRWPIRIVVFIAQIDKEDEIDDEVAYVRPSAGFGVLLDGMMTPLPLQTTVCVFDCFKDAIFQQIERASK